MILVDIVNRNPVTHAWGEGEYIPRDDPGWSAKYLARELARPDGYEGRSPDRLDREASFIHGDILGGQPSRILHIGCGPGLLTACLAAMGHECTGIDVSPAAIEHARATAPGDAALTYIAHDIYSVQYGEGCGLVMIGREDFNTLSPMDAYEFIGKAWRALEDGGRLLVESWTFDHLEDAGREPPSWESLREGLYADSPHLCLRENCFNGNNNSLTERIYVVDAATSEVRYFARCRQAYDRKHLQKLLVKRGFVDVAFHDAPGEGPDGVDGTTLIASAVKTTKYA